VAVSVEPGIRPSRTGFTERRWDINDCRQPVGETPSRRAHRGMGQNPIPDGWAEAKIRGCGLGVSGWYGGPAGPSVAVSCTSMGPAMGGETSWVSPCMAPCARPGSVFIGVSKESRGAESPGFAPPAPSHVMTLMGRRFAGNQRQSH